MKEIGFERNERGKGVFFIDDKESSLIERLKNLENLRTKRNAYVSCFFRGSGCRGDNRNFLDIRWDYVRTFYDKDISISEIIVELLDALIENGYTMTAYAQKQFEYYKGKAKENALLREAQREKQEQERKERELKKQQQQEELNKTIDVRPKIAWCDKYACKTSYQSCA